MGEFNPENRAEEIREEIDQMDVIKDLREEDVGYEEIFVKSFTEAVDSIEEDNLCNNDTFNICLLDIDGVLFKDNIVKLPLVSHLVKPEILERPKNAYKNLIKKFNGQVVIATNRSENDVLIFNSKKVLKEVKDLVKGNGQEIPIYTNLFKQIPRMTKENLSDTQPLTLPEYRIVKPRVDALAHYVGKMASEKDYKTFRITCIEDWSIVSPNRKPFLMYIAKRLKEDYGIEIEGIRNYVIKR